jgi:hypothetical protein
MIRSTLIRLIPILLGIGLPFGTLMFLNTREDLPLPSPGMIEATATAIGLETQATATALQAARSVGSPERSRVQGVGTLEPSPEAQHALASPSSVSAFEAVTSPTPPPATVACADTSDQPPRFEFSSSAQRSGHVVVVECPTPIGAGETRAGWANDRNGTAWFEEGTYRLSARLPGAFVAIRAPIASKMSDVMVSATFRKIGGPPGGGFGLIVRDQRTGAGDGIDQRGRFYVLEVGDLGEIGVWRRDDDHWTDLVAWTPSSAVKPGNAMNEVSVRAIGARLTLHMNGVQVAEVEDAILAEGAVGMFAGGDLNVVAVSDFRVDALDAQ